MLGAEQLRFGQRFPFSKAAKRAVKESSISLEAVPEEVLNRAEIMLFHALLGKGYCLDINSSDLLEQEILAFPVAKILVSILKDSALQNSFALMVSRSAFLYLEKSGNRKELSLELAKELGIDFELVDRKGFFVSVPLQQFLEIRFRDKTLKLVNQSVENGKVFLNINLFCRFLSEKVFSVVATGLPVETSGLPSYYKNFAKQLSGRLRKKQKIVFDFKVAGNANAGAFPPCIALLYQKQLAGESLPHMARFFLATFLNAVGMNQQQILEAFRKSPNFNENIASYQIKRIVEQNYSPASCEKVNDYGFCPDTSCNVRHPISYYRRKLRESRGKKNK